jgi:hypothetical protein
MSHELGTETIRFNERLSILVGFILIVTAFLLVVGKTNLQGKAKSKHDEKKAQVQLAYNLPIAKPPYRIKIVSISGLFETFTLFYHGP